MSLCPDSICGRCFQFETFPFILLFPNEKQNTQKVEKKVEKKWKFEDQPPDAGYRGQGRRKR
jgi:hypothetical protein